jgi:hypothetical protein
MRNARTVAFCELGFAADVSPGGSRASSYKKSDCNPHRAVKPAAIDVVAVIPRIPIATRELAKRIEGCLIYAGHLGNRSGPDRGHDHGSGGDVCFSLTHGLRGVKLIVLDPDQCEAVFMGLRRQYGTAPERSELGSEIWRDKKGDKLIKAVDLRHESALITSCHITYEPIKTRQ